MNRWNDFLHQRRVDVPPPFAGERIERNVMKAISAEQSSVRAKRSRTIFAVVIGSTLVAVSLILGFLIRERQPYRTPTESFFTTAAIASDNHTAIWLFPNASPKPRGE